VLAEQLGRGGEGAVFGLRGRGDRVAKVYHQPVNGRRADKLVAMTRCVSADVLSFAAWPLATIGAPGSREIAGVILPRISQALEIHELYNPARRKQVFPAADYRFLVRAARNCAAAVASLHRQGIVIGDLNQGNVLVSQQAVATLIDCDSFQFSSDGKIFPCEVGVPHFTAPELQRRRFDRAIRNENHDNFALALIVFHLLFMGRHPFAGSFRRRGEMPIERAIREFRFAYGRQAQEREASPPPHCLTLGDLPYDVARLFEEAFSPRATNGLIRPPAERWVETLAKSEKSLGSCGEDPGHFFFLAGGECPWCRIADGGGPEFFAVADQGQQAPTTAPPEVIGGDFQPDRAWAHIARVSEPDTTPPEPPAALEEGILPTPLPQLGDDERAIRTLVFSIAVGAAVISPIGFWAPLIAYMGIPLAIVFFVWWRVLLRLSPAGQVRSQRAAAVKQAQKNYDRARNDTQTALKNTRTSFRGTKNRLQRVLKQHQQSHQAQDRDYLKLQEATAERLYQEHLRRHRIAEAGIPGIGPARCQALLDHGIATAADIVTHRIETIFGFGNELTAALLHWRDWVTSTFQFDPVHDVPSAAVQAIVDRYDQLRAACEHDLRRGPRELWKIGQKARKIRREAARKLSPLYRDILQALADYRECSKLPKR